jgi:hypothetical protein
MNEAELAEFAAEFGLPQNSDFTPMSEADDVDIQNPFSKPMLEKYPIPGGFDDGDLAEFLREKVLEAKREEVKFRRREMNVRGYRGRVGREGWWVIFFFSLER